jgi:hypothetical protein
MTRIFTSVVPGHSEALLPGEVAIFVSLVEAKR